MERNCSICGAAHYCKGLCAPHYQRQYAGGDFNTPIRPRSPNGMSAYDRVIARSTWEGDCFVFTGSRDPNGYGRVGVDRTNRSALAHRVVMEHYHGKSDLYVLHSCDNPPCVRIEHLRYGRQVENMADAIKRGRGRGRSLTDEQVANIRADTRTQETIAAVYGISRAYVSQLKSGVRRKG